MFKEFKKVQMKLIIELAKIRCGGAGYRSRYLSHAKRALYHLSYAPVNTSHVIKVKYEL